VRHMTKYYAWRTQRYAKEYVKILTWHLLQSLALCFHIYCLACVFFILKLTIIYKWHPALLFPRSILTFIHMVSTFTIHSFLSGFRLALFYIILLSCNFIFLEGIHTFMLYGSVHFHLFTKSCKNLYFTTTKIELVHQKNSLWAYSRLQNRTLCIFIKSLLPVCVYTEISQSEMYRRKNSSTLRVYSYLNFLCVEMIPSEPEWHKITIGKWPSAVGVDSK